MYTLCHALSNSYWSRGEGKYDLYAFTFIIYLSPVVYFIFCLLLMKVPMTRTDRVAQSVLGRQMEGALSMGEAV